MASDSHEFAHAFCTCLCGLVSSWWPNVFLRRGWGFLLFATIAPLVSQKALLWSLRWEPNQSNILDIAFDSHRLFLGHGISSILPAHGVSFNAVQKGLRCICLEYRCQKSNLDRRFCFSCELEATTVGPHCIVASIVANLVFHRDVLGPYLPRQIYALLLSSGFGIAASIFLSFATAIAETGSVICTRSWDLHVEQSRFA